MKKEGLGLFKDVFASFNSQQLLKHLLVQLHREDNLQLSQLINLFQEAKQEQSVPLSIFSRHLHPAEALCKYLKEKEGLSYGEIALLLNRHQKSVWSTYQRAGQKMSRKFSNKKENYHLPLSIFNDRAYSLMESIVSYLKKTHQLSNKEMAALLNKSPNSIAVVAKRARKKDG